METLPTSAGTIAALIQALMSALIPALIAASMYVCAMLKCGMIRSYYASRRMRRFRRFCTSIWFLILDKGHRDTQCSPLEMVRKCRAGDKFVDQRRHSNRLKLCSEQRILWILCWLYLFRDLKTQKSSLSRHMPLFFIPLVFMKLCRPSASQ